ncbi:serine protease [Sulfitobacter sp. SK012]|uniref:serine protease n=1 Tax=Sulfitobacter sp. SK012 TaxID=1389005 RepID=UPI0020C7D384|nr:serine protease [Sulfitobacter sp. SK012]
MMAFMAAILVWSFAGGVPARAQSSNDIVWVQIEAQPTLALATDRARAYTTLLQDVNGFAVGRGWYAVAVGPYRRDDAEIVLRSYLRDGLIPSDSFIQFSSAFRQQFWPIGANVLNLGAAPIPQTVEPDVQLIAPEPPVVILEPEPADETPSQARRSERLLTRIEREQLQIALKWAGFYTASIDGSFGRGTRNSMADWQAANAFEQTGILTTTQRAILIGQYNAVLDGLGMQTVRNAQAGIDVVMPTEVVKFAENEPPFVQYNSVDGSAARVLLISQAGDQTTLNGLYEIMQTLEIVPLNGPRKRNRNSFEIMGQNARIVSQTDVTLENGEIKGFTLIWPSGDEDRRTRVLAEMRTSFARAPGVMNAAAGGGAQQSVDLVAGLEVRKPKLTRSGFFVTKGGAVATTSEAVQSCGRITLDTETQAELIVDDKARGVALLKPSKLVAPIAVAALSDVAPRLQSEVALAGYSYGGVLSAPSMSFGKIADIRGLQGELDLSRLELKSLPGDIGGPVLDQAGAVMGMLIPHAKDGPQLPEDVSFTLDAAIVAAVGRDAGLNLPAGGTGAALSPLKISERATGMTVLVSCWE